MIQRPTLPTGANQFCFPFVLGAILGLTTDQIERRILALRRTTTRAGRRTRRVTGVGWAEALVVLGRPCSAPWAPSTSMSIRTYATRFGARYGDDAVILGTRRHVVLMHRGLLADNNNRQWREPADFRGNLGRVTDVYRFAEWRRKRPSRTLTTEPTPAILTCTPTGDPGHVR